MAYSPIAQAQMAHNTLAGIAAGLLSALLFDALKIGAAGGGLILLMLSPLPVFAAGLGWGALSATIATFVGTLVLVILGDASSGPGDGASLGFIYALLVAIPASVWSWQAIQRSQTAHVWRSSGALALMVVGYGLGVLAICGLALASGDTGGDTMQSLQAMVHSTVEHMGDGVAPADQAKFAAAMAELLARIPVMVLVFAFVLVPTVWLTMLTLTANGVLSQALLVRFEHAIRPTPMMADLGLPRWYSALTLVLLVGAMALPDPYGVIVANVLFIQSFALFLAGLAVLHAAAQRFSQRLMVLIAVYAVLLMPMAIAQVLGAIYAAMMMIPMALLLGAIGLFEPWLGLRMRLGRSRSSN